MTLTIIILGILLISSNLYFGVKYFKLRKGLKSYEAICTRRYGFYKYSDRAYVYISELDRYQNGYSKIKLDEIEVYNTSYYTEAEVIKSVKKYFVSLKLTNSIEWLESEDHLRKSRKEKLDQLKKI